MLPSVHSEPLQVDYCGAGSGGGDTFGSSAFGASVVFEGGVGAPPPPPQPTANAASIRKQSVRRMRTPFFE
jgi:hypothetical protein